MGYGQSEKRLSLGEQPIFRVLKVNENMNIDGEMNEVVWSKTEKRDLDYFYKVDVATDKQRTTFRMAWDEENLYVFFQCEDKFITARETNRDGQPYFDDCAEIFLIPVPDSLDTHFGFELNLYKASNDFVYFNNYYGGEDNILKAFNPDFRVAVTYDGTLNNNTDIDRGWTMELAIPLSTFNSLGSIVPAKKGNQWAFLAIRQDRNDLEGNRRSTSTIFPIYDSSVHQSNRFGFMEFVD